MTMAEALRVLKQMKDSTAEYHLLTEEEETALDYAIAALQALMTVGADSATT